ncbi:hypothetical protein GQ54DRAFT_211065 [Martensiomyces pterosporus]|nr:hypothetical protein GQ54DRAFT_211065 [Martensiomyces pterosporus]
MAARFQRLISNPVFAGTLSFMFGGWLVSIVCAFLKTVYIAGTTWFMLFYLLALILALFWAIIANGLHKYRLALLTMIGIGMSLNVGHIGYYINASVSVLQAMSAGMIFVEITLFVWVLVLGSGPGTYLAELCGMGMDVDGASTIGMEHAMKRSNYASTNIPTTAGNGTSLADYYQSELGQESAMGQSSSGNASLFKARALYSYNANPDDPNEVSFAKDEILVIVDSSGKWWQVQKSNGTVGIAPSNYLSTSLQ